MPTTEFNRMQAVKRRFFAMRNGVVADTLRKAGSPFRIIFGLNLPQLADTAAAFGPDSDLAAALWANSTTRESMLLAPMIMPREAFSLEQARIWVGQTPTVEVADILCHRLLRHMPYAAGLAASLLDDPDDLRRYTGLRLMCNIRRSVPEEAEAAGKAELGRDCALTRSVASQLAGMD